jgi:hypothetical protein
MNLQNPKTGRHQAYKQVFLGSTRVLGAGALVDRALRFFDNYEDSDPSYQFGTNFFGHHPRTG